MTTPTELPVYTITRRRIPEVVVPGKRLGRHFVYDSRSAAYPYRVNRARTAATVLWQRAIPILDQGDVGSCTGNAEDGAVGTNPLYQPARLAVPGWNFGETGALEIYSAAETIDGDGPYPPNDNGSCGTSACQAAKNFGLISGYTHATTVAQMIDALQDGPVVIGINWYDSMDSPDSSGLITISPGATVRGGHELELRGCDATADQFHGDNSWGTSWGAKGSFLLGFDDMDRLLSEQGDCTVPVALSQPAPVPVPVPPSPPAPGGYDVHDVTLDAATYEWWHEHHAGGARTTAQALRAWHQAKGLPTPPN